VVVASAVAPSYTVTVLRGSAVPASVGVRSEVAWEEVETTGLAGAVASVQRPAKVTMDVGGMV